MLKVFHAGRPLPGNHVVEPSGLSGAILLGTRQFLLSSGMMDVAASDTLGVAGTVSLTGTDVGGATLSVTGEFIARCTFTSRPMPGNDPIKSPTTPCKPGLAAAAVVP